MQRTKEKTTESEKSQQKHRYKYITIMNIAILSIIAIGIFSWLAPEKMKPIIELIWRIIY